MRKAAENAPPGGLRGRPNFLRAGCLLSEKNERGQNRVDDPGIVMHSYT
jgi:hypothetical protein